VCCAASVPNLDMVESVDDEKVMTFFYEHLHFIDL
jgi:hypothetical protein